MFVSGPSSTPLGAPVHRRVEHCRSRSALHCVVLVEARWLHDAQSAGMVRALKAAGCRVTLLPPDDSLFEIENSRWLEGVNVVVARGRSTALLARLSAAEAAAVPTLNRRSAIEAVADKANLVTRLRGAGIATPRTWIGGIAQLRRKIPPGAFPLVLKPVAGEAGPAVTIETPAGLAATAWGEACLIAQEAVPDDARRVTLYAIGERMWSVRRPFASAHAGQPVGGVWTPRPWCDLATRCGELFGLQLFAVDCVDTGGELQVIDVTAFPDYGSIAEAPLLLARHITRHASRPAGANAALPAIRAWLSWRRPALPSGLRSMGLVLQKEPT